jgi:hypothetical protein
MMMAIIRTVMMMGIVVLVVMEPNVIIVMPIYMDAAIPISDLGPRWSPMCDKPLLTPANE